MSSTKSSLNEPDAGAGSPGAPPRPSGNSLALVVAALALLAALVWALNPHQPKFRPAPLDPRAPGCPKLPRAFVPTNITELNGPALDQLSAQVKKRAIFRMNMDACTCGCNLSIAECRASIPSCPTSAQLAEKVIGEIRNQKSEVRIQQ